MENKKEILENLPNANESITTKATLIEIFNKEKEK